MSEPIDRQTVTSAEVHEHEDARFAHWAEEQAWAQEAQKRKVKIISGFVAVGALLWAWAAMH